jgi:DNA-binding Lrp family transcriptional regulator
LSLQREEAAVAGQTIGIAEDYAIARIATRLSATYVLRLFQLLIDVFGDIRAGLLIQAINTANIDVPVHHEEGRRTLGPDGTFPDEIRRPISIARLAESTGMPFESVRRIVGRLAETGICRRVERGVILPRSALTRPEFVRVVTVNVGYLRRFVRDLQTAGVVEEAPPAGFPPDVDEFTARIVVRMSGEYLLRALHLLVDTYGDIREGIIAQTIVAANTAHLESRDGEGGRYAALDRPPHDEDLIPIAVAAVADSLGMPYETTRGQVRRLVAKGICQRVKGGVIVPMAVLERPAAIRAMLANLGYIRRFVRELRALAEWLDATSAGTPSRRSP